MNQNFALVCAMSEIFRQPLTPEAANAYCAALVGLDPEAVHDVLMHVLRSSDHLPLPRDVARLAPPTPIERTSQEG